MEPGYRGERNPAGWRSSRAGVHELTGSSGTAARKCTPDTMGCKMHPACVRSALSSAPQNKAGDKISPSLATCIQIPANRGRQSRWPRSRAPSRSVVVQRSQAARPRAALYSSQPVGVDEYFRPPTRSNRWPFRFVAKDSWVNREWRNSRILAKRRKSPPLCRGALNGTAFNARRGSDAA